MAQPRVGDHQACGVSVISIKSAHHLPNHSFRVPKTGVGFSDFTCPPAFGTGSILRVNSGAPCRANIGINASRARIHSLGYGMPDLLSKFIGKCGQGSGKVRTNSIGLGKPGTTTRSKTGRRDSRLAVNVKTKAQQELRLPRTRLGNTHDCRFDARQSVSDGVSPNRRP